MSELDDKLPIGAEQVAEATAILQKYKAGKAALDKRIVDNELWFRMGHWKNYQNPIVLHSWTCWSKRHTIYAISLISESVFSFYFV